MNGWHPDFPEVPENLSAYNGDPYDDIVEAIEVGAARSGSHLTPDGVESIEAYAIWSHGERWVPGKHIGSELEMTLLGRTKGGRWFALEAWNDYTGWGCQDSSDLYIGDTREDAVRNGLTNSGREALGMVEGIDWKGIDS